MTNNHQLRWREPWFFSLRMRNRRGWQRRCWLIGTIFVVMLIGWWLDQQYGKGLRMDVFGGTLMSMGIAVFLGFLSDFGFSEVQATDEGIARAFYGHGFGATLWRYQDILRFSVVSSSVSQKPFGLLTLFTRSGTVILGVPDSISPNDLIEFVHRHGVEKAKPPIFVKPTSNRLPN